MKDLVINNLKEFVETHFVTETGSSLVLSPYQEKFIYDVLTGKNPLGKYVLVAATRVGKSEAVACLGTLLAILNDGEEVTIVAPLHTQSERLFKRIRNYFMSNKALYSLVDLTRGFRRDEINLVNASMLRCLSAGNPECYAEGTEVLTVDGWKDIKYVVVGEKVLCADENGNYGWFPVKRTVGWKNDGYAWQIKNRDVDLLVSENHRFVVLKDGRLEIKRGHEITAHDSAPKVGKWNGVRKEFFELPEITYETSLKQGRVLCRKHALKIKMDDWLKFFGIWLAEGSVSGSEGGTAEIELSHYHVCIAQKDESVRMKIREMLKKLPLKCWYEDKAGFHILNKQLWSYLKQFGNCHQKFIPREIKELCKEQLEVLLDWYWMGDGWIHKGQRSYFTVSKQLADDVAEIIMKCGKNARVYARKFKASKIRGRAISQSCGFEIREKKRTRFWYYPFLRKVKYNGMMYGVEVETGILVVRRDGKIAISGNSLLSFGATTLIVDEAGSIPNDVIKTRVLRMLSAAPARGMKPKLILLGTPHVANFLYEAWNSDEFSKYKVGWKEGVEAGILSKDEVEYAKKVMSDDMFRCWFEAEFLMMSEGSLFNLRDVALCMAGRILKKPEGGYDYYAGLDIARFGDDETALVICRLPIGAVVEEQPIEMVWYKTRSKRAISDTIGWVLEVCKEWNVRSIAVEEQGIGSAAVDFLREKLGDIVYPVSMVGNERRDVYSTLQQLIENKQIILPKDDETLMRQFSSFKAEYGSDGRIMIKKSRGMRDDIADALAFCCYLMKHKRGMNGTVEYVGDVIRL